MYRNRIIIFICVLVVGLASVLTQFSWYVSRGASTKAVVKLSVPQNAFNMGTVWEDEYFSWTVPIENQEAESIEVESFRRTCNCLSIEPESFVLGPGERRELRLTIDLLAQTKPTGEVAIMLSPRLKAGTTPAKLAPEWTVHGQVRRVLALERNVYLGRGIRRYHSRFLCGLSQ
jgi:hypothetical protein